MNTLTRLRVRLTLALGAAEIHLRLHLPRLNWAFTCRRTAPDAPFAELQRIETDPAYRALFLARLNAAITDRDAEREAVTHAIEAAAEHLRHLVTDPNSVSGDHGRAA
ncbi:hypothetical protein RM717_19960 [Streptomyces griseus]|uniref:Uncharacterized protein n=1 Tax=Streptomyces stephensoniae TaxID=3375367 RepID=A0ABU2W4K4_9ACTN|nr:hypothetical protein [Streptomyces griseus]MDT0492782.1 hypothetical protein [Streptomyces griseus]